ncbi:MAG: hypothetical protein AAF500_16755 [Myxococcota bacterium]
MSPVSLKGLVRLGPWLAAITLLCSCGFGSDTPAQAPGNECAASTDCAQGVCDNGFCVDMATRPVTLVVEVLRSPSDTAEATPASWVFAPESFSGMGNRDFSLPGTRPVTGTVRWKGERVPAMVRFTRNLGDPVSALAATPVEANTVRDAVAETAAGDDDYALSLVRGQLYDVAVVPTSDVVTANNDGDVAPAIRTLPPVYSTFLTAPGPGAEPMRFDVTFPETLEAECDEGEYVGCTLTGSVFSVDGELSTPVAGLQVRALEKESGRVVSSIAETDDQGAYGIRVSPDAAAYVIRVTSSADAPDPFPSVSFDPVTEFAEDPTNRRVFVPFVETVVFTGAVQDDQLRPVAGANVRFESQGVFAPDEIGFEGTFRTSASTATDGGFGVQVFPGIYDVVVTPPDDAENAWAPAVTQAIIVEGVPDGNEGTPITLASQTTLTGSCSTFTGDAASGVTVAARARSEVGGFQRSQETVSAETGEYEMKVDAGLYDLLIKVSDATGFPWLVEPEFVIEPNAGTQTRDWELPPPVAVRGQVSDADGGIVPSAPIRAYVIIEDNPLASGRLFRAIQVAETVSAEDGTYQLLISPNAGGL